MMGPGTLELGRTERRMEKVLSSTAMAVNTKGNLRKTISMALES